MLIGAGEQTNGVYYLKCDAEEKAFATTKIRDRDLWHQRLGHPYLDSLCSLSTIFGFKLSKNFDECCDVCHCVQ